VTIAALLAFAAGCAREAAPPNIVVISIDTLSRSALRALDPAAAPLPHLDAFAAESVRFADALSTASWTLPAHASLMTGLFPHRHGATDPRVLLSPDVPTLAETLRGAGYETIAVTGGAFVGADYGLERGFDEYHAWLAADGSFTKAAENPFGRAIAKMRARKTPERPLFLFAHTFSVHDYFDLHPWAVERLAEPPARQAAEYRRCVVGTVACSDADWRTLRALYAAEVQHVDAAFGALLGALGAAGLLDDAIVVVTSDHGEGFEPGRQRIHHGGRLQADVVRVPLLIHAPGAAPRTLDARVSLVDLFPTLLEAAGVPVPPDIDGVSLLPALRGGPLPPDRVLVAEEHAFQWWSGVRIQTREVQPTPLARAVVRGDHWYIDHRDSGVAYDMRSDPQQERPLPEGDPILAVLRALADDRIGARLATPSHDPDADLQEQLRALGYVD
jgi:arylsulfatase A-like enzyme